MSLFRGMRERKCLNRECVHCVYLMNKRENSFKHKLYVLSVAAMAFIQFTSFLPNEVRLLSLLVVCLFCIIEHGKIPGGKPLGLLLAFFSISFFYVYLLGQGHFVELRNIALPYATMFTCTLIAPSILRLSNKDIKIIYYTFLIGLLVTLAATAVIVQFDPNAVRTLGFGNAEGESEKALADIYSRVGMISYTMGHILPTVACVLAVQAMESKKKLIKVFLWVVILFSVYVMYSATITTALLSSVMSILLIIVYNISKGNPRRFIVLSLLAVVLLLMTGGLTGLLTEASQGSNNAINEKLKDIVSSIQEGSASGQLEGREDHWKITFNAIQKNPIFGGASGPNDTGQHILFFDYWAWYGIFSLLLFFSWWGEIKRMKRVLSKNMWGKYLLCLLPVLLMVLTKGPHFLPAYFFVTLLISRVGFMDILFSRENR